MQGGHKNKHQTLKSPKGMRSLTHQTWHGDRGLYHYCIAKTVSHPTYSFATKGRLKILGENAHSEVKPP